MAQFEKGKKGGPGRPKGRLNNITLEARKFAQGIVASAKYRKTLREQAENGELPPPIQTMLWAYAYGKPPEKVEITGEDSGPLQVVFGGRFRPEADGA